MNKNHLSLIWGIVYLCRYTVGVWICINISSSLHILLSATLALDLLSPHCQVSLDGPPWTVEDMMDSGCWRQRAMRNTIRMEFLGLERNDSTQGHFLGLAVSLLPLFVFFWGPWALVYFFLSYCFLLLLLFGFVCLCFFLLLRVFASCLQTNILSESPVFELNI